MARAKPPEAIITQHRAYVEWAARRDELQSRLAYVNAEGESMRARVDEQAAEHRAAVRAAIENRTAVPRQPVVVDFAALDEAARIVREDIRVHAEQETTVLAQIAADGAVDSARERVKITTANCADAMQIVEAALRDIKDSLRVMARLVRASDQVASGSPVSSQANRIEEQAARITLEDIASSLRTGLPVQEAVAAITPAESPFVTAADDEAAEAAGLKREEWRRQQVAGWARNSLGLRVHADERGAFATGSPHSVDRPQRLGQIG